MSRRSQRLGRLLVWEAGGVRLVGTPLWMDARTPKELCFVSHAHRDHVARHARTLATGETLRLLGGESTNGLMSGAMPCPYQQPFELGPLRMELLPSGHLPGGAQLLVEHKGVRILFSGDLYDDRQRFARPLVMTTCDVLVLEATYGTPRHRFPSRDEAAEMLREEVQGILDEGGTPLVLVEGSLGRAQEILAELAEAGHRLVASKSVVRWNRAYQKMGLDVPPCRRYGGRPEVGSVLVYPMRSRGLKGLSMIRGLVKIACSGQVGADTVARRMGVDRVIPFVDHADFDGLIRIAEVCRPSKILTVYGHTERMAHELRERGHDADELPEGEQLMLEL